MRKQNLSQPSALQGAAGSQVVLRISTAWPHLGQLWEGGQSARRLHFACPPHIGYKMKDSNTRTLSQVQSLWDYTSSAP